MARTGAGVTLLGADATVEAIREAVQRVLDQPSFTAAATGLQSEIAAMPAAEQVVAELVSRAGRRRAAAGTSGRSS